MFMVVTKTVLLLLRFTVLFMVVCKSIMLSLRFVVLFMVVTVSLVVIKVYSNIHGCNYISHVVISLQCKCD